MCCKQAAFFDQNHKPPTVLGFRQILHRWTLIDILKSLTGDV